MPTRDPDLTQIVTERLCLRRWREDHRGSFAEMHSDPEVMADLGGPIDQIASDAKFDRYVEAYRMYQTSRWAVESRTGSFLGYAGVMPRPALDHPLGFHYEVGWRFRRMAWGHGYAAESALAALRHAVRTTGLKTIVAYTGTENTRSQAVMRRLGLRRQPDRDFTLDLGDGRSFDGLVWDVDLERFL